MIGWLFGLGHFAVGNQWIAISFTYQSAMPIWLGYVAVFALSLYLAIFPAMAAFGAWKTGDYIRKKGKNSTIPFALAFAAFWILGEWLRSWLFTGFAWNPLSVILPGSIMALPLRAIGSYGASGIVILYCAIFLGLVGAILTMQGKAIFARALDFVLLTLISSAAGWMASGSSLIKQGAPINVTITQPNISQIDKYKPGYEAQNFAKLSANSRPLNGQGPRLLLWPEAAIPYQLESGYPYRFYQFQPGQSAVGTRMVLAGLLGEGDILITGADRLEFDDEGQLIAARNSLFAMDANGELRGQYDKAHLVPFGEYLPIGGLLKTLGLARLVPGNIDYWPGPGARTLDLGMGANGAPHGKVGIQICYEIIFSGKITDRANRPDFILNSSNDAWFGTIGPPQFIAQARLRAIEEGLPIVRSTPTGISAIINADGNVTHALPLNKPGRIDAALPKPTSPTLFARFGNMMSLIFAGLLMAFAFLPVVTRFTSR